MTWGIYTPDVYVYLIHFSPMSHFYTSWKRQKAIGRVTQLYLKKVPTWPYFALVLQWSKATLKMMSHKKKNSKVIFRPNDHFWLRKLIFTLPLERVINLAHRVVLPTKMLHYFWCNCNFYIFRLYIKKLKTSQLFYPGRQTLTLDDLPHRVSVS